MKNIREYQLKKCIFMSSDEYERIIKEIFGQNIDVEFTLDGMIIGELDDENEIYWDEIASNLARYFDVKEVTSVHMDDIDAIGVWICYKE